jgi:hypothetical protein
MSAPATVEPLILHREEFHRCELTVGELPDRYTWTVRGALAGDGYLEAGAVRRHLDPQRDRRAFYRARGIGRKAARRMSDRLAPSAARYQAIRGR